MKRNVHSPLLPSLARPAGFPGTARVRFDLGILSALSTHSAPTMSLGASAGSVRSTELCFGRRCTRTPTSDYEYDTQHNIVRSQGSKGPFRRCCEAEVCLAGSCDFVISKRVEVQITAGRHRSAINSPNDCRYCLVGASQRLWSESQTWCAGQA